jgi:hypothetical protein
MILPFRAGKRFIFRLRHPFGDDFTISCKTANVQTAWICGAAAKACVFWTVLFLE